MAELWSISSLTRGWYDTRAKHPYRVVRPGKPRPRDRIAYNSLYPYRRTLSQWIQPSTVSNLPLPVSSVRLSFAPSLSSTLSSLLCVMYRSMLGHVCPYSRVSVFTLVHAWLCVQKLFRPTMTGSSVLSLSLPLDRYKGANWQYRENARKLAGTTFNDVRKFVNARQKWSIISGRCLSVSRHIASRFMHFASPWNFAPRRCTRLIRSQWKL